MAAEEQTDEVVTVAGGVEMEVHFQNNGTSELVKVRQIPISKVQDFLMTMGNEAHSIEIYCEKPKGWADTLTLESATAIADLGQKLNRPFLRAWWRRQARWREMQKAWIGKTNPEAAESRLANSAPQSPSITT
jgi:hypothetical protein